MQAADAKPQARIVITSEVSALLRRYRTDAVLSQETLRLLGLRQPDLRKLGIRPYRYGKRGALYVVHQVLAAVDGGTDLPHPKGKS